MRRATCLLGLVLAPLLACDDSSGNKNNHRSEYPSDTVLAPGERGRLVVPGGAEATVAVDEAANNDLHKYTAAQDRVGFDRLLAAKRSYLVPSGTKIHVIGLHMHVSEVRMLDGPHKDKSGWVANDWIQR
mgnify:CR=1 FL=1